MGQISVELSKRLDAAVGRMPAFPRSVQKILEMTRDINCLPKNLVAVIEKDPVITIKILRIINSAYYAMPQKITSINQSVVYLGLNTIKNMSLSFATVGMLPRMNSAGFDIQQYLMHSLITANVARMLCSKYVPSEIDPNDCYIAGLLHDFGKVVFAQFMPGEFRKTLALSATENLPLHIAEEEIIGADHTLVGSMLAGKWQFPQQMIDCIGDHHSAADGPLAECLQVADRISENLGYDSAGNLAAEKEEWLLPSRFGDDFDAVIASLGDLNKVIEDASLYAQQDSPLR